jgi:enterochelin esterase-like enzyme
MRDPQELRFRSRVLQNERILWLQPPPDRAAVAGLVVLLDGEYHVGPMDSPRAVAELQRAGRIPPVLAVYVSHLERDTRWRETRCNPSLAAFLADELRPWACAQANVTPPRDTSLIGGLSLTGLAAAHAALLRPEAFGAVLAQSGSFWWRDGQLAEAFRAAPRLPLRFHLSCGDRETTPYVEHGPDLTQRVSQIASNRAFRDALIAKGYPVAYVEVPGSHEPAT